MNTKYLAIALVALSTVSAASPAFSQSVVIGPGGVRVIEPQDRRDDRRGPPRDRDRREVSEREAIRIARDEGVREVDNVRRTRRAFSVIGADRRGRDIRVDVDRITGEVLAVR